MKIALKDEFSSFRPPCEATKGAYQPRIEFRPAPDRTAEAKWIRQVMRARASRESFFGSQLFADPAWDMLLELYWSEIAQRRISVSKLSNASGSPLTTALRWISALQKNGFVARMNDPLDGRRVFVRLTDRGREAMSNYLASLPESIFPFAAPAPLAS
jgi:DNA-binding MarR family transcriptional regulator